MNTKVGVLPWKAASIPLVLLLALLVPQPAKSQAGADSQIADSHAAILAPGTIIRIADMNFGTIAVPSAPGTVVLSPAASGTCTTTGGLVQTGDCQAASYTGDMTFLYVLRITKPPGGQIDLTGPGGATMRVNNFTFGGTTGLLGLASTATEQRYLVLSLDGRLSFHVGGTLRVAANQRSGIYTGTFVLQFNYD